MFQYEKAVSITVHDNPEAPGGKAGFAIYRGSKKKGTREFTGKVAIVDKNHSGVALWRQSVREAARPNRQPILDTPLEGPLVVRLFFSINKPASVRRVFPTVRPDVDNYVKPTFDELTRSAVWRDDSLVVSALVSKAYVFSFHADGTPAMEVPGCVVDIFRIMK